MNISKLRIVIDDRERKSGIPKLLQGIGINAEIKTLPVGDYIVAPETIVERKSISDLISSVFDGRLFDQCTRLRKHYKNPIIIVEGNIDDIEKITSHPLKTVSYGICNVRYPCQSLTCVLDAHRAVRTLRLLFCYRQIQCMLNRLRFVKLLRIY